VSLWQQENIPDQDNLYMRIHKMWIVDGYIRPGAFRNRPKGALGMSTDWQKYSDAVQTKNRCRNPSEQALIILLAGMVRAIPGQTVEHKPLDENRAHTDIIGEKDEEVRLKFTRIYKWMIRLQSTP